MSKNKRALEMQNNEKAISRENNIHYWINEIEKVFYAENGQKMNWFYHKEDNYLEISLIKPENPLNAYNRMKCRLSAFSGETIFKIEYINSMYGSIVVRLFPYSDDWFGMKDDMIPTGHVNRAYF